MSVSVRVDTNAGEDALFEGLRAEFGESVVRSRLDLGDVEVTSDTFARVIVERKKWSDFVSSLRDGRYANQKLRLLAERERSPETRILYLIETARVPPYEDASHGMPNNQPYAALVKMGLRDGITLVWSASAEDSAKHVAYLIRAGLKGGLDAGVHAREVVASGYAGAVKFTGKRKNADDNTFQIMLASLTGVSAAKAAAVVKLYPSPAALLRAYDALGGGAAATADDLLADVPVGDKRLGPALSRRIRAAFFGRDRDS